MVAGHYIANGAIMGNDIEMEIHYEVNGQILTGTLAVQDTKIDVLEGTAEGNEFHHQCKVSSPMEKMKLRIDGQVEGDVISFVMKAPVGKAEFVGKRI